MRTATLPHRNLAAGRPVLRGASLHAAQLRLGWSCALPDRRFHHRHSLYQLRGRGPRRQLVVHEHSEAFGVERGRNEQRRNRQEKFLYQQAVVVHGVSRG